MSLKQEITRTVFFVSISLSKQEIALPVFFVSICLHKQEITRAVKQDMSQEQEITRAVFLTAKNGVLKFAKCIRWRYKNNMYFL